MPWSSTRPTWVSFSGIRSPRFLCLAQRLPSARPDASSACERERERERGVNPDICLDFPFCEQAPLRELNGLESKGVVEAMPRVVKKKKGFRVKVQGLGLQAGGI